MTINNHTFYFAKSEYEGHMSDGGWEAGWDFRLVIDEHLGELRIEDRAGRYVPMVWQDLHKMKKAIASVEHKLVDSMLEKYSNEQSV